MIKLNEHGHPNKHMLAKQNTYNKFLPYQLGCFTYVFTGVGHLATEISHQLSSPTNEMQVFITTSPTINLLGKTLSLYELTTGFSLAMGGLLVMVGLILLAQRNRTFSIYMLAIITSAFMLCLSLKYFFIIPVVTMSIATICFSWSMTLSRK